MVSMDLLRGGFGETVEEAHVQSGCSSRIYTDLWGSGEMMGDVWVGR